MRHPDHVLLCWDLGVRVPKAHLTAPSSLSIGIFLFRVQRRFLCKTIWNKVGCVLPRLLYENSVQGNKYKYLQSSYSHPHIEQHRKINYKRCKWLGYYTGLHLCCGQPLNVFKSLQLNLCSIRSISTQQIIWDVSIMPLLPYSLPSKTGDRQPWWKTQAEASHFNSDLLKTKQEIKEWPEKERSCEESLCNHLGSSSLSGLRHVYWLIFSRSMGFALKSPFRAVAFRVNDH